MRIVTTVAGAICASLLIVIPGTHANAELLARDLDGDNSTVEAYYDTVLDITWLADARLAASETFGVEGINEQGRMYWDTAVAWIEALNAAGGTGYLGIDTWRLPNDTPLDPVAFPDYNLNFSGDGSTDGGYAGPEGWSSASELGHMYYVTLGNLQICDVIPETGRCRITRNREDSAPIPEELGLVNTGPFENLEEGYYWASQLDPRTEDDEGEPVRRARGFNLSRGFRLAMGTETEQRSWPVAPGDVGTAMTE